jgi:hypothetical protein
MGYFNKQGDPTLGTRDPQLSKGKQTGPRHSRARDGSNAKEDREIQHRPTGRHTNGTGGRHYADTGVPDGGCASVETRGIKTAATERLIRKYNVNFCLFMELNYNWSKVSSSANLASWFTEDERET